MVQYCNSCQFFWSVVVGVTRSRMLSESVPDDAVVGFGCFKAML